MDIGTGWQIFTTIIVGLIVVVTMKVDVANLKDMVKELREENKEIKDAQKAQEIKLAMLEGMNNVRQYANEV